jgi:uncharacterized protein
MRILIDTNCLLMIVPKFSSHYWLMQAIQIGKIELVVTTEILEEYEEILGSFYSPEYATLILKGLLNLPNIIKLNPIYYQWGLITVDIDDNKFVDAYIASNADYIITYDKHFKILNNIPFPKVQFCNLTEFEINYAH